MHYICVGRPATPVHFFCVDPLKTCYLPFSLQGLLIKVEVGELLKDSTAIFESGQDMNLSGERADGVSGWCPRQCQSYHEQIYILFIKYHNIIVIKKKVK